MEHQVLHPLDYARVIQKLGNDIERSNLLEGILPQANIMTISMSASSSTGLELSESELTEVYDQCRVALELDDARQKVLFIFGTTRKGTFPNLVLDIELRRREDESICTKSLCDRWT